MLVVLKGTLGIPLGLKPVSLYGPDAGLKARSSTVMSILVPNGRAYFTPFGYTRILLASPVFRRSMPLEKSFIEMRSVITG